MRCLKYLFLFKQSFTNQNLKKKEKDPCHVCIFFMIVIFINVSDTAGVAVLLNL